MDHSLLEQPPQLCNDDVDDDPTAIHFASAPPPPTTTLENPKDDLNQNHQNHNEHQHHNDVENPSSGTDDSSSLGNDNRRNSKHQQQQRQLSFTNRTNNSNSNCNTNSTNNSQRSSVKTPKDTLQAVYKAGIYKASLPLHLLCIQSFIAGTYIALAGHIFLQLNGGLLGAIFFPTGIIATVFTSAELFTGDALVFVASVLGNKVSIGSLLRNWTISWIFNFMGCLAWASVLGYASGALDTQRDFVIAVAMKKVHATWIQIFIKAIGANFLVCLGVWQATCAEEAAGKILALWFPVAGFVIMGFDHVIANQFLIPMGMMFGADISITHLLLHALLPATLGNIVGGGICIGAVYWYVFDSMGNSIYLLSRIRWHPIPKQYDSKDEEISKPDTTTILSDVAVTGTTNNNKRD